MKALVTFFDEDLQSTCDLSVTNTAPKDYKIVREMTSVVVRCDIYS